MKNKNQKISKSLKNRYWLKRFSDKAEGFALALMVLLFFPLCVITGAYVQALPDLTLNAYLPTVVIPRTVTKVESKSIKTSMVIREVTMYNAGDPRQTDDSPCIGAANTDICQSLAIGKKICAANFVPLGTILDINNYGQCVVLDRMNSRYANRVDIAVQVHEKTRALNFGKQNLAVAIIK